MNRITQCLSIGPFASAERAPQLLAAEVTHVLNVSDDSSHLSAADGFTAVAWVPMRDDRRLMHATAVRALDALHAFAAVPGAHVYVHCVLSMVRSPTILWLYLIALGVPPEDAREMIESRAPRATAGHFRVVDDAHVLLAQMHGLMHYFTHPRPELVVPFPPPEAE